jgi:hypothetical protein
MEHPPGPVRREGAHRTEPPRKVLKSVQAARAVRDGFAMVLISGTRAILGPEAPARRQRKTCGYHQNAPICGTLTRCTERASQDSNLESPVLETGALSNLATGPAVSDCRGRFAARA